MIVKPFVVTLIAVAALTFALPGKAAAQGTLDQKFDKIIRVLEKIELATDARFQSIDQKLAAFGSRLDQFEQKGNSYPPSSPPAPVYSPPTYTPPMAQNPPVYYQPAYEFQPLPNSPLSGDQQKALNDYFDRVCNRNGEIRMSPAEQQGMTRLMQLLGK